MLHYKRFVNWFWNIIRLRNYLHEIQIDKAVGNKGKMAQTKTVNGSKYATIIILKLQMCNITLL